MDYKSIKQAKVPIFMSEVSRDGSDSYVQTGQRLSATQGREVVVYAVKDFVDSNKDNPAVQNPFGPDGNCGNKEVLYTYYDKNVALSNWNDIASKYGEHMQEVVDTEAIKNPRYGTYEGCFTRNMLSLGSQLYYAESEGMSEELLHHMIDVGVTNGQYIDTDRLEWIRNLSCVRSDNYVLCADEVTSPAARQAVDFYLGDTRGFDKDVVRAIGTCKDIGQAYNVYSMIRDRRVSPCEAQVITDVSNQFVDFVRDTEKNPYVKNPDGSGSRRFSVDDMEQCPEAILTCVRNGYITLQDGSAANAAHKLMNKFLESDGNNFVDFVENPEKFEEKRQELDVEDVIHAIDYAQDMNNPKSFSYKFDGNQIDIEGKIIESSWEYFRPAVTIRENGDLLYTEDSCCVDDYYMQTYTQGQFSNLSQVRDYLHRQYDGQLCEQVDKKAPIVPKDYKLQFHNAKYQEEYDAMQAGRLDEYRESKLDRIVFKDLGLYTSKKGTYHRVDFAYACDNKIVGEDSPVANPYLISSKRKRADGKLETVHSYYLPDSVYNTLMSYANTDGIGEDNRWSGVIAAEVGYPIERCHQPKLGVNLTKDAVRRGKVVTPSVPFDEKAHSSFVKASLTEIRKERIMKAFGLLPEVDEAQPSVESSYGE